MLGAPELPARIFPVSPHKVAPFSTFILPFSILLSSNTGMGGWVGSGWVVGKYFVEFFVFFL